MKALCLLAPALAVCAAPAFAYVTVSTPTNNAIVVSPFTAQRDGIAVLHPADLRDGLFARQQHQHQSSSTAPHLSANVTAATGAHILHVKSWGNRGASCVADVAITVGPSARRDHRVESDRGYGDSNPEDLAGRVRHAAPAAAVPPEP